MSDVMTRLITFVVKLKLFNCVLLLIVFIFTIIVKQSRKI